MRREVHKSREGVLVLGNSFYRRLSFFPYRVGKTVHVLLIAEICFRTEHKQYVYTMTVPKKSIRVRMPPKSLPSNRVRVVIYTFHISNCQDDSSQGIVPL